MLKVLVVEDEELIRKGIVLAVDWAALDCVVVGEASNGEEALDAVERLSPSLIITDLKMPRMDGIRATMKIREISAVPIIFLSAKSEDVDKILGLNVGADDYITKPFNPLELNARVK